MLNNLSNSKITLLKDKDTTTRKRDKYIFDVDDLVSVFDTWWIEDDFGFLYKCVGAQMTFLILAYSFTEVRVGVSLENGCGTIETTAGEETAH